MLSIHGRLLLVASLVLAAFLGLGALALDSAFRESVDSAMRERLQQQVYALLGAAKEDELGRMRLPEDLPNPRFAAPDSGLYATVSGEDGAYRWRSRSLLGREIDFGHRLDPGAHRFERRRLDSDDLYILNFAVAWEDDTGRELGYTLAIAENTGAMEAQIDAFRIRLFYWLGGVSLLLLIVQGAVLGWGLMPLRRIAGDLRRVESGEIESIAGWHPRELQGLIDNINMLIQSGRASRDRYRNGLGDLAHSLKTPLTLLRGSARADDADKMRRTIDEQVARMDEIVQYQLRRAAASSVTAGTRVSVATVVERLCATLSKVYRDKQVACRVSIDPAAWFYGEQSDLMEFMGNLLDNAFKYGKSRVRVTAESVSASAGGRRTLKLVVEDDGPGIPPAQRAQALNRGVRIDQHQPGHGIGLSVAREIIHLYRGALKIDESGLGGARIEVTFG
ncbi:MAG: histidine kinase [Gammaproteobacteria bacterium]|nr:histidine kinase [Gammaproteobacteria bacterium]